MADLTPESSFEELKKNTIKAIQDRFPDNSFEGRRNKLVVTNVHVDDKLQTDDITGQSEAKDRETTWGVPIRADVKLVDRASGKTIDEKKGHIVGRLPKITNRYGFIVGGNEYQVDHLFRLKSGIYARVQDNGDLESEFNLAKSPTGRGFSIKFDQANKKFMLKQGESHIPLYPVLKAMGVSDDTIEANWGKDLFEANKPKNELKQQAALRKFVNLVSDEPTEGKDLGSLQKMVVNHFDQTALRPDTTTLTVGKPFHQVTGDALQTASTKLLGVARGTHKPDDRDSLAFKEVVGVEDFIPEKIGRSQRTITQRLRQTLDHKKTVGEILTPDIFNKPIHEFFSKGGSVSERSDQTNPLQMISAHRKTTLMSSELGGISDTHQLTDDMRAVNPSHLGFLDPMHTPESERTGITLHLASNVVKRGRTLEVPVFDVHSGKRANVEASVFHSSMAVLPDQVTWKNGKPYPIAHDVKMKMPGGDIVTRPFKEAQYVMPSAKGMWNYNSNLIPFLASDNGNRVSMADKQMEQAIGLKHREAPLVQTRTDSPDPTHTYEDLLGHFTATKSPVNGTVTKVLGGVMHVKGEDGKKHEVHLYDNFPLNDPKGMMHSESLVAVGDKVRRGQIVADNNFTKNGKLALGANLRVGYLPYKGYNFEDGIVVSETAAQKLTSEHLYKKELDIDPATDAVSLDKFKAFAIIRSKGGLDEKLLAHLDENGVVKPGTRLMPGQVMVAAVGKNDVRKQSALSVIGKRAFKPYRDKSLVWDEDHEGVVTKVVANPNGKGFKVYVKTEEPLVIGDKLSGRHGNKGIITQILPDREMPFTLDPKGEKQHLEVALNPSGVPTRMNVGQVLETAAGKIAEKTGKPYLVNNFSGPGTDYRKQVLADLKAHGLTDEEQVFDPDDVRKPLGSVLVGPQYLMKLKHQVEKKLTVRGGGTDLQGRALPDDVDHQPAKGGEKGGQGFGALEMYALLGHDARHNIREMATYKSDTQDQKFWNMVQQGHEPPPPKPPFSYEKFTGLLRGMGVNVEKEGTSVRLLPMTHKEILQAADNGKNEITRGHRTLRTKDLKEEVGGLFDPNKTGGLDGTKWSFMRLAEPMPNPVFVGQNNKPGPVPVLLNLKMAELNEVMAGTKTLNGKTGGLALEAELKKIDVEGEIAKLRKALPGLHEAALDRANKKLKYLLALKAANMKPADAYILHSIPVIPPQFRPATLTPAGDVNYAPINGHYKNIALINDQLKNFDSKTFSAEHKNPLRVQLWDSVKAMEGIGKFKPVYDQDQSGNRALKGILQTIGGDSKEGDQPKEGYFQSKLVKRRQNLSIRSTIIPEPKLGIDEVGLPRNAAMELYKPFVVAQLGRWGIDPLRAQEEMKKNSDVANKALEQAVQERPLLLKRDPVLHKYGVMAFKPVLVKGKAIQIHPLVTGGYNADFDGDTMAGTVPMSREAVEEAKKLFPSNNLFSSTSYEVMHVPGQESLLGLHLMTEWGKKTSKTFKDFAAAKAAYAKNEITLNDVIHLKDAKGPTTLGRIMIAEKLPKGFKFRETLLHDPKFDITSKSLKDQIATPLAKNKEFTSQYAKTIDALKDLGNEQSFRYGYSFGLKDFETLPERDAILARAKKKAEEITHTIKDPEKRDAALVALYSHASGEIDAASTARHSRSSNRLARMVYVGARGKRDQLRQMIAAPMLMKDSSNRTLPTPVTRSYAEGLDVGDYWISQHGARKGTLQRTRGTSEPGAISKNIINSAMGTLISKQDCKTNQGIFMALDSQDVHDRYLAAPYKLKDGTVVRAGELVTPELINRLRNSKQEKVMVRSPLKCALGQGICAKCYGLNESGKKHPDGTNIGIIAAQAMGEPATQLTMDSFHTGGVASAAGGKSVDRIARLKNLIEMPDTMKNQATVATQTGKITDIKKDSAGGIDIYVNGVRHFIPHGLVDEKYKVGLEVKKGEQLSKGYINPHHLMHATKDIAAVQNYLTNELHGGLFGELGVRRRNIEVGVRSITNLTKVRDPGDSDWAHGDVMPRSVVEEYNRQLPKGKKPVLHDPILRGVKEVPASMTTDWMARLNYQQLHATVQQGAAQGWKSDLHGQHPIPGMAYGAEFGKPPPIKPKHNY